jgi:hypothetical protein
MQTALGNSRKYCSSSADLLKIVCKLMVVIAAYLGCSLKSETSRLNMNSPGHMNF